MQCYSELVPPTGVTQALTLPFTSATANNLVIARTSLLQVFSLKQVNQNHDTKLVLVAEFPLAGTVTSLGRVKGASSKSGGEAVLVALRDAKLSLIEWDPASHSISTISIHYYEQHDLQSAPWSPDLRDCVSHLTVDPSSRCAAFNFGVSNLAILPFHQSGDDLAMDDFDSELNEDADEERDQEKAVNGHVNGHSTPYFPSFVLPMTVLDPGLLHPVDMAFLHEYRDPTVGILYSTAARSANMAAERKDVMIYAVYALDLEQKASTTLQSVQGLPNDLFKIMALPLPVGGALLVGANELIHIDQGGKSSAIGVNELAREASAFSMADHSDYRMKLEGCQLQQLGNANGDMLMVLSSGEVVVLSFRLDGRSVSGMSLRRVEPEFVLNIIKSGSSCMENIGQGRIFVGSEESDSVLIATLKTTSTLKRQPSRAQIQQNGHVLEEEDDDDDDDMHRENEDDEDDFYADNMAPGLNGTSDQALVGSNFRLLDYLPCIAPLHDVALGGASKRKREDGEDSDVEDCAQDELELAISYGKGRSGGLAFYSRELEPRVTKRSKYDNVTGVWCFNVQEGTSGRVSEENAVYDDHVIVSISDVDGTGRSSLMTITNGELEPKVGTEFDETAGTTISIARFKSTNHTAQVTPTQVRVYDSDFGLSQIFEIVDEDEGNMAKAIRVNFAEPYLVILKEDLSMTILKADKSGELDEVQLPPSLKDQSIQGASLYLDTSDFFGTSRFYKDSTTETPSHVISVLTVDGLFCMLSLPNINVQIFQFEGLHYLPSQLGQDIQIPRHWRNKDDLEEVLLADLGDENYRQPHLIVRNSSSDITLYQPFAIPEVVGTYKFKKVVMKNAKVTGDLRLERQILPPMQILDNASGCTTVFVPGTSPMMIIKRASTMPHIYSFRADEVKSIHKFHHEVCTNGFIFIDDEEHLCIGQIPDTLFTISDWLVKRVELGQDSGAIAYYAPTRSYVLGANYATEFVLPKDDEWHPEWQNESIDFYPTTIQSCLRLMSSKTHSIISQYNFDQSERVLCVKCMNLEVSEETHERKTVIVVGTAVVKGENVTTRGNLYIFDVVDVVPQPDIPETDLKLKLITKEDVRGAVTAISEVGSQGFVLAAQGQKCMVRGLKEDLSVLPVAFLDMRYYVKVAKELGGTGLCILGDAFSGLWLTGYSEEPYKLQLLGRDLENPEVITADFLPDGKQLFIITSDGDGELRQLQYDPENPKSERGAKLLLRSTFNSGSFPTTINLLPRTPVSSEVAYQAEDEDDMDVDMVYARHQLLITTQEGGIALITPVSDQVYRRLSSLQNILITNLEHPCGLNPRAYRQAETDGVGGRAMIDGNLVRRWLVQSSQHKTSTADKVGGTVWDIRSDLEAIDGSGLGYL